MINIKKGIWFQGSQRLNFMNIMYIMFLSAVRAHEVSPDSIGYSYPLAGALSLNCTVYITIRNMQLYEPMKAVEAEWYWDRYRWLCTKILGIIVESYMWQNWMDYIIIQYIHKPTNDASHKGPMLWHIQTS